MSDIEPTVDVPDDFEDMFAAAADEPSTVEPTPAAARRPLFGTVVSVAADSRIVRVAVDGADDVEHVNNPVFPALRPGLPIIIYPAHSGGWSTASTDWYILEPMTPRDLGKSLKVPKALLGEAAESFLGGPDLPLDRMLHDLEIRRFVEELHRADVRVRSRRPSPDEGSPRGLDGRSIVDAGETARGREEGIWASLQERLDEGLASGQLSRPISFPKFAELIEMPNETALSLARRCLPELKSPEAAASLLWGEEVLLQVGQLTRLANALLEDPNLAGEISPGKLQKRLQRAMLKGFLSQPKTLHQISCNLSIKRATLESLVRQLFPETERSGRYLSGDEVERLIRWMRSGEARRFVVELTREISATPPCLPADFDQHYEAMISKGHTYGGLVDFVPDEQRGDRDDYLCGTMDGLPAVIPRVRLRRSYASSLSPLDPDKAWKLMVVDPRSSPIRLSMARKRFDLTAYVPAAGQAVDVPREFYLAMHELAGRVPQVPAIVRQLDERGAVLDVYGVALRLPPEQLSWDPCESPLDLLHRGQQVRAYVSVDLETSEVEASLKSTADPAWRSIVDRYGSEGSRVSEARLVARTSEGLIFDLSATGVRIHGLVPYGELTDGNDPFGYHDDLDRPQELMVIGHDEGRRRLILSRRKALQPTWRPDDWWPGRLIPVKAQAMIKDVLHVSWAGGHMIALDAEGTAGVRRSVSIAAVVRVDHERREPEVVPCPDHEWTIISIGQATARLRSDNGSELEVETAPFIEEAGVGARMPLAFEALRHLPQGNLLTCRPRRPSDDMIARLYIGMPIEVLVFAKTGNGLRCLCEGLEVYMPRSMVHRSWGVVLDDYIGKTLACIVVNIDPVMDRIIVSHLAEEKERRKRAIAEIHPGQIRTGKVSNIADFGAFVDVGGIDGLLHITDMSWGRIDHPSDLLEIDDRIEVMVLHVDKEREKIALGLKQRSPSPLEDFEKKHPPGSRVTGEVVNVMSYGAFVRLEEGLEGLVHISEMSWTRRINHPSEVVNIGDRIDVIVLTINREKEEIGLGMKQAQDNPWDHIGEKYPPGSMVEGTVRNLTNYGAFIEIEEGIDGLLHISDMSWTRKLGHPNEFLDKGERIRCQVLSVDQDRKRIALGLKQLQYDPWEADIPGRYKPGDIIKGRVTKLTNFGAFVELEPYLEGLLHISELADVKVALPEEVVKVGDELEVRILRVDRNERKIGLSRKKAMINHSNAEQGDGQLTAEDGESAPGDLEEETRELVHESSRGVTFAPAQDGVFEMPEEASEESLQPDCEAGAPRIKSGGLHGSVLLLPGSNAPVGGDAGYGVVEPSDLTTREGAIAAAARILADHYLITRSGLPVDRLGERLRHVRPPINYAALGFGRLTELVRELESRGLAVVGPPPSKVEPKIRRWAPPVGSHGLHGTVLIFPGGREPGSGDAGNGVVEHSELTARERAIAAAARILADYYEATRSGLPAGSLGDKLKRLSPRVDYASLGFGNLTALVREMESRDLAAVGAPASSPRPRP